MLRFFFVIILTLGLAGCGHNPHLDARKAASEEAPVHFQEDQEESDFVESKMSQLSIEAPKSSGLVFDWPMDEARLTQKFNPVKKRGKRRHLGIDLAAPKGTGVFAAHDGVVIYVGKGFRGFGKMILVENSAGWATLYAHLSQAHVIQGQSVRVGDSIAAVGNTGRSSGPHLHFELRQGRKPVDPLTWLPSAGVAELHRKPKLESIALLAVSEILEDLKWPIKL